MLRLMVLLQLVPRFAARSLLTGSPSAFAARVPCARMTSMATSATSASVSQERLRVAKLLDGGSGMIGETVTVKGWVRTIRQQKKFAFIEVNDGSSLKGVQVCSVVLRHPPQTGH